MGFEESQSSVRSTGSINFLALSTIELKEEDCEDSLNSRDSSTTHDGQPYADADAHLSPKGHVILQQLPK